METLKPRSVVRYGRVVIKRAIGQEPPRQQLGYATMAEINATYESVRPNSRSASRWEVHGA